MSLLGSSVNREDGRGWGRPPMEGATGPWDGCCLKPGPSLSTRATPPRRRYLRSPRSLAPLEAILAPLSKREEGPEVFSLEGQKLRPLAPGAANECLR